MSPSDRSPVNVTRGADRVRCRLLVAGRVQGVGFRYFARTQAQSRGLAGFARNLDDGRVEVDVEGPPQAVEAFVERIRQGPPASVVRTVNIEWAPPRGGEGFRVE